LSGTGTWTGPIRASDDDNNEIRAVEGSMLQLFGFDRIGIVIGDLYFLDPVQKEGQEGAEHGVRLEVRMLEPGELRGSIYSARPISIGAPMWRADLLETVDGPPGSLNRAHHHPRMSDWEPNGRTFDEELTADPVAWIGKQLSDLEGLLDRAGVDVDATLAADADSLRGAVPEVQRAVSAMLAQVKEGRLGTAPADEELSGARISWL
jgi:hypothetical protein